MLGVTDVRVSPASQVITLRLADGTTARSDIERVVTCLGYQFDRLAGREGNADKVPPASRPAPVYTVYRRGLWIIVLLNVRYGLVEIVGGFIAASQALKADALDSVDDDPIDTEEAALLRVHAVTARVGPRRAPGDRAQLGQPRRVSHCQVRARGAGPDLPLRAHRH